MDPLLKGYLLMVASGVAVALVFFAVASILDVDGYTGELISTGGVFAGIIVGVMLMMVLRKRSLAGVRGTSVCYKLRDVCSILSYCAVIPTVIALVSATVHPSGWYDDMPLISAVMIFISMLLQAVFWHKAENIGSMSLFNVLSFVALLILMNFSSLLAINYEGWAMLVISLFPASFAVMLMLDWAWSVDVALIGSSICAVASTVIVVLDDPMQFGLLLSFWLPPILLLVDRYSLKGSFLMSEEEKLFRSLRGVLQAHALGLRSEGQDDNGDSCERCCQHCEHQDESVLRSEC